MTDATAVLTEATDARLLGQSAATRRLDDAIDRAARSDANVLITGEAGVGTEVVARLIHNRSARASAGLVMLNCTGVPDPLLESELFGHVRGGFAGAYRDKPGVFERAPNGTVFLDGIGELGGRLQAMLVRFLQSGEIRPVGSDRAIPRVNVRLITAANQDLTPQVASGAFRLDLYRRLNAIQLAMAPLRERSQDIPFFVDFFLRAYAKQHAVGPLEVSPEAMAALTARRWPGNVRELKNVIERIVLKATGPIITLADIP